MIERMLEKIRRAVESQADSLDVSSYKFGNKVTAAIAETAPGLHSLSRLRITKCALGPDSIEALGAALRHLTSLTWLNLGNNHIGSEGITELAKHVQHMTKIQCLGLYRNHIGSRGLTEFVRAAAALKSLDDLDLADNPIGNEGAEMLAANAANLPRLRRLGLFDCGISDWGLEHLRFEMQRPPWLHSLEDIGFRGNDSIDHEPLLRSHSAVHWRTRPAGLEANNELLDIGDEGEADMFGDPSAALLDEVSLDPACERAASACRNGNAPLPRLRPGEQWALIIRVIAQTWPEWNEEFQDRLRKHDPRRSEYLEAIHDLMLSHVPGRIKAYPDKAERGPGTSFHKYAFKTAFETGLLSASVLRQILWLVLPDAKLESAAIFDVEHRVYCCTQCGAVHQSKRVSNGRTERPPFCSACQSTSLLPEAHLTHVRACDTCGLQYKAGGQWPRREDDECAKHKSHRLSAVRRWLAR